MSETEHHHPNYVKIWAILLVLLVLSVLGPELGIREVTLFTAFGIAVIKAYMVAKNFMHVNLERRYVAYMLLTGLLFMLLFFAGAAPDVMKAEGVNWEKPSWLAADAAWAATGKDAPHH
jgi:caa(3)-type oxidase subunit IV